MVGYSPESFWDQTIRTMKIAMEAKAAAARNEHNGRAWAAWHTALLMRSKKMIKLDRLFARESKRRQSWQEQMAIMGQIAADRRRARSLLEGDDDGR